MVEAIVQQRWFLSYHTPDEALAHGLKAAIERNEGSPRVFFAPLHLRAGRSWSSQLAQEIAEANAFVLLVGERGIGDWQIYEYDEALDKRVKSSDFPVVMVLLEGQTAPGLPFLRRLHWIITKDPASEKDVARLFDAAAGGGENPGELWRYTTPYRGLAAMEEKDSEYFFGRSRETRNVLHILAAEPDRLPVLIGNSGVGKSSLARAGVLAALKRQAWPEDLRVTNPWPAVFHDSRQWCFLVLRPGTDPIKALVDTFIETWQFEATDPMRIRNQQGWIELLRERKATLVDLIEATQRRHEELDKTQPPAFFLYIDQGEELYIRSDAVSGRRFSELLANALDDARLHTLMSLRADFFGELQRDQRLHAVYHQIEVPPLREAELLEVISRPAAVLSAGFETPHLAADIARRTAEESAADAGALPLLSYLLDDMWRQMIERGDGLLRLPAKSIDLGLVLVERARSFIASHPRSEPELRRILTLKLANVREDGEPTRRRAYRSEFSTSEWRLVGDLADYPLRLLVTATHEAEETFAEVAHEAIFRRWDKLREWIAAEREFLAWRSTLDSAHRAWQAAPAAQKDGALLMGLAARNASHWLNLRAADISAVDRDFIALSAKAIARRQLRGRAVAGGWAMVVVAGVAAWFQQDTLRDVWRWYVVTRPYVEKQVQPYVLSTQAEREIPVGNTFKECAKDCPEMVVISAGFFTMGASDKEKDQTRLPRHTVRIKKPFAISKYPITYDDWDVCSTFGDCPRISHSDFGRGRQPLIGVTWDEAQHYAGWLSLVTGKPYRLPTEAEYEYAARAGTTTAFPWGDEVGVGNTVCNGCGTEFDNLKPAVVGSFAPNHFGLYDMVGNVWEWTEDCWHSNFNGAPADGSAWTSPACYKHVVRGGSYVSLPSYAESAGRFGYPSDGRYDSIGFRLARTLAQ